MAMAPLCRLSFLLEARADHCREDPKVTADSDEAGHAFQSAAVHVVGSEAVRDSDLISATLRRTSASSWDML
jgi:hypothetical protein